MTTWSGLLTSVQPRVRMLRSYDERSHSYLGFVLGVKGRMDEEAREFLVAVGEAAHGKHAFRVGDVLRGAGHPIEDPRMETADLFRVSKIELIARGSPGSDAPPPWKGVPPALPVYRERGHRRLDPAPTSRPAPPASGAAGWRWR